MNNILDNRSQLSTDRLLQSTSNSQRPIRLPKKKLMVNKRKGKKKNSNSRSKTKLTSKFEGNPIFASKKKYKSPTILSNVRMEPIISNTPKVLDKDSSTKSIKNIRTVYRVSRQTPKAIFGINRLASIHQYPVSVDKYGNKLGFGNELNYNTVQYSSRREHTNRLSLNSRGTVLRMFSDTESEVNFIAPEITRKQVRNLSQPILPTTKDVFGIKKVEDSVKNLPEIVNVRDRVTTPGYVGEEAYTLYYQKFKRLTKEKEVSPTGYSASTAYLTS